METVIERSDIFRGTSPRFLKEIHDGLVEERHEAGDLLFRIGETADHLYMLAQGRVRLSYGEEGRITLVVGNPGGFFGWSSLLERDRYLSSAECQVATTILKIRGDRLAAIFEQDPASGLIVLRRLARLIEQRLISTYQAIPGAHGERRATQGG